jgi:hypothetical protein
VSTNACIARVKGDGFEGRYHHWDGNPSALGAKLYHEALSRGTKPLLKLLLDDHPAGWSSIVNTDLDREPGFTEYPPEYGTPEYVENRLKPACYCHGDRHEGPLLLTRGAPGPWAYVFDEDTEVMTILRRKDGEWHLVFQVPLNEARELPGAAEPDWRGMEHN